MKKTFTVIYKGKAFHRTSSSKDYAFAVCATRENPYRFVGAVTWHTTRDLAQKSMNKHSHPGWRFTDLEIIDVAQ